ncbi:MAG: ATP-dependent endonuclease [Nitrospirota bacterium]
MYLSKIEIKNYRLLEKVELYLEAKTEDKTKENETRTTVIVGRNNSGKTSLTELFRRLLEDKKPSFNLEDLSLSAHVKFIEAFKCYSEDAEEDEKIRKILPVISVKLSIRYEDYSYGPLSEFIVDLNEDCNEALIEIRYQLQDKKTKSFFSDIDNVDNKSKFYRIIKERFKEFYAPVIIAVDPNDDKNQKISEWSKLNALFKSGFINAQRGIVDVTHKDINQLGKIFAAILESAETDTNDANAEDIALNLKNEVEIMQDKIDLKFKEELKKLIPDFSLFGYPGLDDPNIVAETTLDVKSLMQNNTKILYENVNGADLPETYSGMGMRNLIFILLKLYEFFRDYRSSDQLSRIHLIFIEEPEAHLHPQMQEVFIKQIDKISDIFSKRYNDGIPWPVQFVITTHSSHLANQASFESIRYFHTTRKTFKTQIKDMRKGLHDTPEPEKILKEDREFLHKFMTLTRCDLFFADKAVLFEGLTERLLLPMMINKIDSEHPAEQSLSSQYISYIEVGGAYAYKFFKLLDFLELPALIITDIDSVKKNAKKRYEACKVSESERISNTTIKKWCCNEIITPAELIRRHNEGKTDRTHICRLAYQVPETNDNLGPCGRSFEEAFILANLDKFGLQGSTDLATAAWEKANEIEKKSDFAMEYLICTTDWNVPRYIREGFNWFVNIKRPDLLSSLEVTGLMDTV